VEGEKNLLRDNECVRLAHSLELQMCKSKMGHRARERELQNQDANKSTGKFRSTKVLQQHPCIRLYLDKGDWACKDQKYPTYQYYMMKSSQIYYINTYYLSRLYNEKWLKKKLLYNKIDISVIHDFINNSNIVMTRSNVANIKKTFVSKKSQDLVLPNIHSVLFPGQEEQEGDL